MTDLSCDPDASLAAEDADRPLTQLQDLTGWLEMIHSLAPGAPIFIVGTHCLGRTEELYLPIVDDKSDGLTRDDVFDSDGNEKLTWDMVARQIDGVDVGRIAEVTVVGSKTELKITVQELGTQPAPSSAFHEDCTA